MKKSFLTGFTLFILVFLSTHIHAKDKAVEGLIIGAGSGAILGQAIGGNSEATVIGTAVGGILGYMIGADQNHKPYHRHYSHRDRYHKPYHRHYTHRDRYHRNHYQRDWHRYDRRHHFVHRDRHKHRKDKRWYKKENRQVCKQTERTIYKNGRTKTIIKKVCTDGNNVHRKKSHNRYRKNGDWNTPHPVRYSW